MAAWFFFASRPAGRAAMEPKNLSGSFVGPAYEHPSESAADVSNAYRVNCRIVSLNAG